MATPRELILNKKLPMAPFEINAVFALLSFALGILTLVVIDLFPNLSVSHEKPCFLIAKYRCLFDI